MAPQASSQTAIIEVKKRGLYEITYNDLEKIGFPVGSVNVHNLNFTALEKRREMNCRKLGWHGRGMGIKPPRGESILFYAEPQFSRWADFDTYLLREEDNPGKRMVNRSSNPSGLPMGRALAEQFLEQNSIYTPDCYLLSIPAGYGGDHWAWDEIKIPYQGSVTKSYNFDLSNVDTGKPDVLTLWLFGFTVLIVETDHMVMAYLDNTSLIPT